MSDPRSELRRVWRSFGAASLALFLAGLATAQDGGAQRGGVQGRETRDDAGWLGIFLAAAEQPEVVEVVPESPAEAAGLRSGDRILAVDGAPTARVADLAKALAAKRPGERIELRVGRGDSVMKLSAVLARRPGSAGEPGGTPPRQAAGTGGAPGVESAPTSDGNGVGNGGGSAAASKVDLPSRYGLVVELGVGGLLRVVDAVPGPDGRAVPAAGDVLRAVGGRELRGEAGLIALPAMLQADQQTFEWERAGGDGSASQRVRAQWRARSFEELLRAGRRPDPAGQQPAPDAVLDLDAAESAAAGLARAERRGQRCVQIWLRPDDPSTAKLQQLLSDVDVRSLCRGLTLSVVDAATEPDAARRAGVVAVPHVAVVDGRGVLERLEGLPTAAELRQLLAGHAWRAGVSKPRRRAR